MAVKHKVKDATGWKFDSRHLKDGICEKWHLFNISNAISSEARYLSHDPRSVFTQSPKKGFAGPVMVKQANMIVIHSNTIP